MINSSDGVVAISSEIKTELLSLGVKEEKIFYIPNGVNLDKFNTDIKINNKDVFFDGSIVVAFCGAIIKRKRPHLLIESLKLLPDTYKVCLIGPYNYDDSYVRDLFNYISDNNLKNRVLFTGFVNNPEEFLKKSRYFCLPSENEGMPNALLEAMACGCIPIATDISGVKDIICDSSIGYITMPDANSISNYILSSSVIMNKLEASAINRVRSEFSAQKTFSEYMKMYKGIY